MSEKSTSSSSKPHAPEIRYVNLYEAEEKIYTRHITGFYQRLRRYTGIPLLLGYLLLPWLVIDGRPAMLFDLPARQFNILWVTFSPQDGIYLAWLLIIAAFLLFTITTMVGRVWCGFTCPQTVWTQMFMWAELVCEGDRNKRIKLDAQPWSLQKLLRKTGTHLLWISIALVTGLTFIGYFTPVRALCINFFSLQLSLGVAYWVLFFTGATYMNAGFMREQICKYACPYARFQAVMFDHDTLSVFYNKLRGETRGPRKIADDYKAQGLGDCIDCSWCVQVCPVNIDIRDGLQAECIDCGLCVDACNSVMEKMNYPLGLISFTTENSVGKSKIKVFRPRVLAYGAMLLIMVGCFVYSIAHRVPLIVEVLRDRGVKMYRVVDDNIQNIYTIKIENLDRKQHIYDIRVAGEFPFDVQGYIPFEVQGYKAPPLLEGEILTVPIRVAVKRALLSGEKNNITITLVARENSAISASRRTTFIGPAR